MCACLLMATVAVLALAGAVAAGHRARGAADLAAVAGARAAAEDVGADPCLVARGVARANRGEVESCEVVGDEIRLTVAVRAPGRLPAARAQARAGPAS